MSLVSEKIFRGGKHFMSSPYGKRSSMKTSAGTTSSFHSGTDYGTYKVKLPQYAIAYGYVESCGVDTANANGKYVWVRYDSLGVRMMHYHLDSISCKNGDTVKDGSLIGYTGMTGRATGIHLHLGIKKIGSNSWIDPEKWSENEYKALITDEPKVEVKESYTTGTYKVNTEILRVRKGAGTKYDSKTFSQLSKDAQKKILSLNNNKKVNGYIKGMTFSVSKVKNGDGYSWGKTPSGWVALEYCKRA